MSKVTEIRAALGARALELGRGDATVHLGPSEYGQADTRNFVVRMIVGHEGEESAENLDELLSPVGSRSVKESLERGRNLDGLVINVAVTQTTGHRLYPGKNARMLGAEWTVQIVTKGDA